MWNISQQIALARGHRFLLLLTHSFAFVLFFCHRFCQACTFVLTLLHTNCWVSSSTPFRLIMATCKYFCSWCTATENRGEMPKTYKQMALKKEIYATFIWIHLAHSKCIFHINQSFWNLCTHTHTHNSAQTHAHTHTQWVSASVS